MSDILNTLTKQITENQILPADQMTAGFDEMMEGKVHIVMIVGPCCQPPFGRRQRCLLLLMTSMTNR